MTTNFLLSFLPARAGGKCGRAGTAFALAGEQESLPIHPDSIKSLLPAQEVTNAMASGELSILKRIYDLKKITPYSTQR